MTFWSDEKVAELRDGWEQEKPVNTIAGSLGCTKNAVIGKARRLRLPMHPDSMVHPDRDRTPNKPRTYPTRRTPMRAKPKVVKMRPAPATAPDALNIAFDQLEHHHCRYATTRDKPFLFCGANKSGESSYCAFHHALCHEPLRGYADRRKPFLWKDAA